MEIPVWTVDAFADRPFSGNPASVCVADDLPDDETMQSIAAEMNHAETAFLAAAGDSWRLRWFTPQAEVELCGHATLAAAHVLWETGRTSCDTRLAFDTASGRLTAGREEERIALDFPAEPAEPIPAPDGLEAALGATAERVARNRMDFLVEVEDEDAVVALEPDLRALSRFPVRGVIVTARSRRDGIDFVSRFFAPAVGVAEDPVTGSAHCALAPWWSERVGRTAMVGRQLSARGGTVGVRLAGTRVHLIGRAVTVLEGRLRV